MGLILSYFVFTQFKNILTCFFTLITGLGVVMLAFIHCENPLTAN